MAEEFSDDVCQCIWCSAIYIISLSGMSIPISSKDMDEMLSRNGRYFSKQIDNVIFGPIYPTFVRSSLK